MPQRSRQALREGGREGGCGVAMGRYVRREILTALGVCSRKQLGELMILNAETKIWKRRATLK